MKIWSFLNNYVFLYPLYMSFVWTIGALVFYMRREVKPFDPTLQNYPAFSIIVPAHNEATCIEETVKSLLEIDYPNYEILVVDDGCTDKTRDIVYKIEEQSSKALKIIHLMPNSGKSKALNAGILLSTGEIILTIDADCVVDKDILKMMAWHFVKFPTVGAVTGNPRIRNRTSLLAKIQLGEYSSIIGLIKRAQRVLGKILTVSGVTAAYRKSAFIGCGLFDSDTVTEDIDMTWKLQRKGWDIRYEPRAISWILSPESISGLWGQRVRWAQGGLEVLKKHYNIWFDFRERRFWPVYFEYVASTAWAFCLGFLALTWAVLGLLYSAGVVPIKPIQPFFPPAWMGSLLALMCLLQSLVSLYIDSKYEKKTLFKYYFWIIWYPFFYWMISASAVFVGFFNVFIKRGGVSVIWKSPDRGLQTL